MTATTNVSQDVKILRDLARRYAEVCQREINTERRNLWRAHNSLRQTRPLLYMRVFACWHEMPESKLACADPLFRQQENTLRSMLFQASLDDDYVFEPWLTQRASLVLPGESAWGPAFQHIQGDTEHGSWKYDPVLKDLADVRKLVKPFHRIDEAETSRNADRLREAVGDILPVHVDRSTAYRSWTADIANNLAHLRGMEQIMWDMCDNPEWLHELLAFMRDGILAAQQQAEDAGDWTLANHDNQAMPYAEELADPAPNGASVKRSQLWCFMAAQEYALVSPEMHDEFLLQYQLPILKNFGLVAYGCCEDLTKKIDILRQIPNLRRIAITPWANLASCAEQIGTDYVISWRPNPAEMVCTGFNEAKVRKTITEAVSLCRGLHMDVTLKDVETVQNDPDRLRRFVRIFREVTKG